MRAPLHPLASLFFFVVASVVVACSSAPEAGGPATAAPPNAAPPVNPGESQESKDKPKDSDTQIVVGLDAEDFRSQGFTLGRVDVTAKVGGVVAAQESLSAAPIFPHELHLVAPKDAPDALVELEVSAHDSSIADHDVTLLTRTASGRFVKGSTKLLFVYLEVRCNTAAFAGGSGVSGPTCKNPGETCIAGACHADRVETLPDYRADWAKNPPSSCGSGAPEITFGQGERAFAALADGDTVTLEEGMQCGHHFWVALEMKNLSQFGTTTTIRATQPGSSLSVPATAYPYAYAPNGGSCELVGLRFQVDAAGKVSDYLGKPLDVTIDATDKAGVKTSATRHLLVAATYPKGGRPCP